MESASIETRADAEAQGAAKYWQGQLELAEQDAREWVKDGQSVVKRYKSERLKAVRSDIRKFNILYSNTETLKAALFARMAKPDIRRRFSDKDPVGKQVAEIVERAAIYCQDSYDSEKAVERAIEDYLLPGRGIVRVCYDATTAAGEDGKEYVAEQELYEEYVHWEDFRCQPAKTWPDVMWESFRHKMSRDDLRKNFKELGEEGIKKVPLNWSPKPGDTKVPDSFKRAEVWEVFDKTKRQRVWVVNGYDKLLRTDEDPYNLEDFFPNAEPLQAITTNDTLIPAPEFTSYRDQADGLDEIESRIDKLTRALKRRGVYDATFKELAQLAKAADNQFIAVKNYADLSTKGGLAAAFQSEDISVLAKVLAELHIQRDLRVQTIYEVVGIADIMRGSSDPRETLGAQKIKAQFGGNRLKKRQDKVQKWIRDTLRIKTEIIAEHFEPQKLAQITGFKYIPAQQMQMMQMQEQQAQQAAQQAQQMGQPAPPVPQMPSIDTLVTDDMVRIMRDDKMRSYRIDVETDSTVFEDAEAEKQAVTEMLKASSEFIVAWVPVIQAQPAMLDMAFEMLAFALRHFKMGRSLEEVIEQTKSKLQQAAQQPKPPSPEQQKVEAEKEAMQAKLQADQQAQAAKLQADQQAQAAKLQADQQAAAMKIQMERERHEQTMAMEREKHAASMQFEREKADEQARFRIQEADIEAATREQEAEQKQAEAARKDEDGKAEKAESEAARKDDHDKFAKMLDALNERTEELARAFTAPRVLERGKDGRATGYRIKN